MEDKKISKEVELLEEEFKDRYTKADAIYMEIASKPFSTPPVVYPWNSRSKQTHNRRWNRGRGFQGWGNRRENRDRHSENKTWFWRNEDVPSWAKEGSSRQNYRDREKH